MSNITIVYKYLVPAPRCTVELPAGAKVLTADRQHNQTYIWALVDPVKPTITRRVYILGTGHEQALDDFDYVSTFMLHDGAYVYHVFVEREK